MATIKSGATTDIWTIDATSKAGRVTMYDTGGTPINPAYSTFMSRIEVVPTLLTTGTTYWTMKNTASGGGKTAYIRAMSLNIALIVNSATATTAGVRNALEFERFTGTTPTAGTAIAAIKRRTADATATVVTDIRFAAGGVTTTGVSFDIPFLITQVVTPTINAVNQGVAAFATQQLDYTNGGEEGRIALAPGEGLAIRASGAVNAGLSLYGSIWWDER